MSDAATGTVRTILRIEGLCVFSVAVLAYAQFGAGWAVFAILFLTPDLFCLGYFAGARAGAAVYNAAHSYVGAIACLAAGALAAFEPLLAVGLIWSAHIGFDRALGYGLKYPQGFKLTHLGRIGRAPLPADHDAPGPDHTVQDR